MFYVTVEEPFAIKEKNIQDIYTIDLEKVYNKVL